MNGDINPQAGAASPGTKPWEKPWSIDELKKSAGNWSLACDAGMLQHVQEYSQRLISQTHDIQAQMDGLAHEAKLTNARLSNVFNDFITLANTQFMENRVYDEEVSQPVEDKSNDKIDNKIKSKEEREAELIPKITEAISLGLNVFDSAYETLDMNVANSDSEDEVSVTKADLILEPKDPYLHRTMPYLIGSEEFHRLDDLGLKNILAAEKEDSGSESEEEADKQIATVIKSNTAAGSVARRQSGVEDSDASSSDGDLFGSDSRQKQKIGRSHSAESDSSSTASSSIESMANDKSAVIQTPKPMDFTSELAAKLSIPPPAVTAARESVSDDGKAKEAKEKKPKSERRASKQDEIKRVEKAKVKDDLFGADDADDGDDLFSRPTGLFSSKKSKGLFDNDDDDDDEPSGGIFGSDIKQETKQQPAVKVKSSPKKEKSPVKKTEVPDAKPEVKSGASKLLAPETKGLFDEGDDDDDDDLFAVLSVKPRIKVTAGQAIISDVESKDGSDSSRPSSGVSDGSTRNKPRIPPGAVSLFGGADDPFKTSLQQKKDQADQSQAKKPTDIKSQKSSLLVKDSSSNQTSSGTSSLFGDDEDDDDLFGASLKASSVKTSQPVKPSVTAGSGKPASAVPAATSKQKSAVSLFSAEDEAEGDDDDLFGIKSTKKPITKTEAPKIETKKAGVSKAELHDDKNDDDDDLFSFKPKSTATEKSKQPESTSQAKPASGLIQNEDKANTAQEILPEKSKPKQDKNKILSLFGGDEDDDGDLFGSSMKKSSAVKSSKSDKGKVGLFADDDLLFGSEAPDTPGVDLFKSPVSTSQKNPSVPTKSAAAAESSTQPTTDPVKSIAEQKPSAAVAESKKKIHQPTNLFADKEDDDDDLFASKPAIKIPPGAVSIFGNQSDILKQAVSKRCKSSSSDEAVDGKSIDSTSPQKQTPISKPSTTSPMNSSTEKGARSDAKPADTPSEKQSETTGTEPKAKKPLTTASLFSEEENADGDDLFSAKPIKKIPPGAVSVFGNQSDMLKEAVSKRRKSSSSDETVDGKSRDSISPQKQGLTPTLKPASLPSAVKPLILENKEADKEENRASRSQSNVAKLQSTLNIDPTVHRPGATPKSLALVEVSVGFNVPANPNTLTSVVKDRVKVQTKRRPPTRSQQRRVSDVVDGEETSEAIESFPSPCDTIEVGAAQNIPPSPHKDALSNSMPNVTDKGSSSLSQSKISNPDDDLFSFSKASSIKPGVSTEVEQKKKDETVTDNVDIVKNDMKGFDDLEKPSTKDLQQREPRRGDITDDLFSTPSQAEPVKMDLRKVPQNNIPSSMVSDKGDDLFTSVTSKQPNNYSSIVSSETNKITTSSNKPTMNKVDDDLFSSSGSSLPKSKKLATVLDDDDDLFGVLGKLSKADSNATPGSTWKKPALGVLSDDDDLFGPSKSVGKPSTKQSKDPVKEEGDLFSNVSSKLLSTTEKAQSKPITTNPIDNDDDIFSSSSVLKSSSKLSSKSVTKPSKPTTTNDDSDDDIFKDSSLLKSAASKPKLNMHDNGDDDDIFADSTLVKKTPAAKPTSGEAVAAPSTTSVRKKALTKDENLFADDTDIFSDNSSAKKQASSQQAGKTVPSNKATSQDDEEDIFGNHGVTSKSSVSSTTAKASLPVLKRTDSSDIFDDPLKALQK